MSTRLYGDSTLDVGEPVIDAAAASRARRESSEIYLAASKAVVNEGPYVSTSKFDGDVVEHMLRAVIEVLTPEQRALILKKVSR